MNPDIFESDDVTKSCSVSNQKNREERGKLGWTGTSSFVLEVPLRNLRPSVIYSVPYDRFVQKGLLQSRTGPGRVNASGNSMKEISINQCSHVTRRTKKSWKLLVACGWSCVTFLE